MAAPAIALVSPWRPELGRPGVDGPVHIDSTPVAPSATAVLAVLRRPQTEQDRELAAPLIRRIGTANLVDRVQTESIRMVGEGWALVPVKVVLANHNGKVFPDQLCLTDGRSTTCQPADRVASRGVWLLAGGTLAGLVPDGVHGVRFTPDGGTPIEMGVRSNFFTGSVLSGDQAPSVKAPARDDAPSAAPAPPPRPLSGTLEWLDADGQVVGPEDPRILR